MATVQTIREAKIVIHLEQGRVELKAPQLAGILQQQQQQLDLTQKMEQETRRLNEAEKKRVNDELAGAAELRRISDETSQRWRNTNEAKFFQGKMAGDKPPSSTSDQAREAFYNQEINQTLKDRIALTQQLLAEEQKLKASQAGQDQAKAIDQQNRAVRQYHEGLNQASEGVFRLARAAVLLGGSDESMQKLIRNLAIVQAGYDLFKGSTQIIGGLAKAQENLAKANALAAASGTAASAGMAPLNPILAGVAISVGLAALAWSHYANAQREADEAQKEFLQNKRDADALITGTDAVDPNTRLATLRRQVDEELALRQKLSTRTRVVATQGGGFTVSDRTPESIGQENDSFKREADFRKQILQIQEDQNRKQKEKIDVTERDIKQQQQLLSAANRLRDSERERLESFRAQIAKLSPLELQQLKAIDEKLQRGDKLNRNELSILEKNAGSRGQDVARAQGAKEFEGLGLRKDFLGSEKAYNDAAKATEDLTVKMKELTAAMTGKEKLADLADENRQLLTSVEKLRSELATAIIKIADEVKANSEKIANLKGVATGNR
jgi:hypothetical protein